MFFAMPHDCASGNATQGNFHHGRKNLLLALHIPPLPSVALCAMVSHAGMNRLGDREMKKMTVAHKTHADFNYVMRKIAHLKRIGLVGASSTGFGENGGACPDWLRADQKKREESRRG